MQLDSGEGIGQSQIISRLIKYTTGDAKEMTKNCIQLPAEIGFEAAKRLLIERYSDSYRIIAAYRKEIKN